MAPVIVDLNHANGYMFTRFDIQAAAKLSGPTIDGDRSTSGCYGKATERTAADQRMDKRFQFAVVPAPGVTRANDVGKQMLTHPKIVLAGGSHVELNGDVFSETWRRLPA